MPHLTKTRVFPKPPDVGNPPDIILEWARRVVDSWRLTRREREVCELMLKGLSNDEIGAVLSSPASTIKHHIVMIFLKAHVDSRSQLFAEILRL
jgi:ATP/maltotriose-dependent transcriptional regulator MalT